MRIATRTFVLALAALALVPGGAQAKATAAQSCAKAKVQAAGKAASCRLTAAGVFLASAGATADIEKRDAGYAKCQSKMDDAYAKADAKYGTDCAVPGNATPIDDLTVVYSDDVVRLNQPRYVDNGNGTVTDNATGLVWEKKTDDGSVHDKDNTYTWTAVDADPWPFDGTAKTAFLDQLNCQGAYASGCTPWLGHSDWRLPTIIELGGREEFDFATGGIVDCSYSPCINPSFGPTGPSGQGVGYLSSSTNQGQPYFVWVVRFDIGSVAFDSKSSSAYVRAVRGG